MMFAGISWFAQKTFLPNSSAQKFLGFPGTGPERRARILSAPDFLASTFSRDWALEGLLHAHQGHNPCCVCIFPENVLKLSISCCRKSSSRGPPTMRKLGTMSLPSMWQTLYVLFMILALCDGYVGLEVVSSRVHFSALAKNGRNTKRVKMFFTHSLACMLQSFIESKGSGNVAVLKPVAAHLSSPKSLEISFVQEFVFRKVALVQVILLSDATARAQSIGPVCGLRDSLFGWFKRQPTAEEVRISPLLYVCN